MLYYLREQLTNKKLRGIYHEAKAEFQGQYSDLPIPQIKCSYRPSIVQACLYLIGRVTHGRPVTYAGPGKSKHNRLPSKAIDIKFTSVSSKKEREELFFKFAELMCKRGAKWGGHWKHLRDLSHFELAD